MNDLGDKRVIADGRSKSDSPKHDAKVRQEIIHLSYSALSKSSMCGTKPEYILLISRLDLMLRGHALRLLSKSGTLSIQSDDRRCVRLARLQTHSTKRRRIAFFRIVLVSRVLSYEDGALLYYKVVIL
jgi:hypothetical protein